MECSEVELIAVYCSRVKWSAMDFSGVCEVQWSGME